MRGIKIYVKRNNKKIMEMLFSIGSNLQTHYHFKLNIQEVDQHTGGKWLIYGPKHRKDMQSQILELTCKIS